MNKNERKAYAKGYKQAQLDYSRWFVYLPDALRDDILQYKMKQGDLRRLHDVSQHDVKIKFRAQDVFGSFKA